MIKKLDNGNTIITLGEGTVFSGNVSTENGQGPFGIYFSNQPEKTDEAVIIHLSGKSGIASYLMGLVRYLEAHSTDDLIELHETIEKLKAELEPLLPIDNTKQ